MLVAIERRRTGSAISVENVRSLPMLLSFAFAPTGRESSPRASASNAGAPEPTALCTTLGGSAASSPTVATPRFVNFFCATGPTPPMAESGSGARNAAVRSGSTTSIPWGFARDEAIFATDFEIPTPTEQVRWPSRFPLERQGAAAHRRYRGRPRQRSPPPEAA